MNCIDVISSLNKLICKLVFSYYVAWKCEQEVNERSCYTKHIYLFLYGLLQWLVSNNNNNNNNNNENDNNDIKIFYKTLCLSLSTNT